MFKILILSLLGTFLLIRNGVIAEDDESERYQIAVEENLIFEDDEFIQMAPTIPGPIKLTWMQAVNYCISDGKKLASADSDTDLSAIITMINDEGLSGEDFWLSGRRLYNNWYWIGTGKAIKYTKWNSNQPNSAGDTRNCMLLKQNQKFSAADCDQRAYVVCEDST